MAKNMPVPNTRALNGKKIIGNQSHISDISRLLLDTIYREERYLKTAAYNISHVDADEIITSPSQGISGLAPCFRTGCLT
jgi:hypothetical protein